MPYEAIRRFEKALCEYTGAPYAVAVSSCTDALEMCLRFFQPHIAQIPRHTYVGVAQAAVRSGYRLRFIDAQWSGMYELCYGIFDAAKRFTSGMYVPDTFQCLSFHVAKILGDSQGGAILHDYGELFDKWARQARFDGRTEGVPLCEDKDIILGMHCYMSSDVANRLHAKLISHSFPKHNPDQCPEGFLEREYGDLSQLECFKPYTV